MMMMMNLVLFLLCSGLFQLTLTNRLRTFMTEYILEQVLWAEAKNNCENKNATLVTLYDEEDVNFIANGQSYISFWVGLHRKNHVTTWSNGYPFKFSMSKVNVNDTVQLCEAIENNKWRGFPCSDKKPFMCYNDNEYILIEKEPKDWCQARHYCRRHYTDLVSISNETENDEVIIKGNAAIFWIGLMHDRWEWFDKGCSTYRKWFKREPATVPFQEGRVFFTVTSSTGLLQQGENDKATICARGSVRIKVINKALNWEEALDYCEVNHTGMLRIESEQDQEAVSEWLEALYKDIPGPLWIGLKRRTIFGSWFWNDSIVTYSNWMNGTQYNKCGAINSNSYTWTDENCCHELPFICEEISFL